MHYSTRSVDRTSPRRLYLLVVGIMSCVSQVALAQRSDLVLNVDATGRWECLQAVGSRGIVADGQYFRVIQTRLPDPAPGFRAYDVSLSVFPSAPEGSWVNALQQLNFSGVHQVWDSFRDVGIPTQFQDYFRDPSIVQALGGDVNSMFVQGLDSYMNFGLGDYFGAAPSETNDGQNPGNFDETFGQNPLVFSSRIGIGDLGIINRVPNGPLAAAGLFSRDRELPLAHVVIWHDYSVGVAAILSGDVGGSADGNDSNGVEIESFRNLIIGGRVSIPLAYNRMCPEPIGCTTALAGVVGLVVLTRRTR